MYKEYQKFNKREVSDFIGYNANGDRKGMCYEKNQNSTTVDRRGQ